MLEILLKKFGTYNNTCAINDLRNRCVTFLRDEKYIPLLKDVKDDIWIIAHTNMEKMIRELQEAWCPNVNVHYTDYPEFEFTLYHNRIHQNKRQRNPCIGNNCKIHPTVIMDVDGMKAVNTPTGEKIHFIHTGHVLIGDNVNIGPYTVIHRGTLGMTSISSGCQIGSLNNIGHNCRIGINNVLAAGVILNGGIYTGSNCWFGSGSIVKHYTTLYDNVVIGHGAVVTKDIDKSGIYVGNPARFLKPIEEGWNF